ncbi:hypothetical protein COV82_00820 [Candidatus Peregrinibacteria bacterium CG11_big_fil_rev_8_21_14_0_20_46_8]|nr:MAG: hypothetical protein COV82_00820 [Candidatus Peregrinibacteria bacterium CG11_big_fil_rev_8_21_14_0_20_46_8]
MDYIFVTGIIGSLVLVTGAAWPESKKARHPVQSAKNWLFAIGGLILLLYALLGYLNGGPIFFVFLEVLILIASILMMLNVPDRIDIPVILGCAAILIIWSLALFEDYRTIIFILGLAGVGLGYAFDMRSLKRDAALTGGSILIAFFSYTEGSWIFFWLNVFFAIFSAFYLFKHLQRT